MTDISRRNLLTLKQTFASPDSGPEVMRKRYFPNVPLVTHEGKHVRFYDDLLKGKLVVINLMYADCTTSCPMITANLLKAQKILQEQVRQDIFFYSLTVKPHEDTPQKLKEYAAMHHVGRNWLFLTGNPSDLELLRNKLGYVDPNPEKDRKDRALHSGMVRYGNEPLSQWSSIQGSADPAWIAEEITFVVPRAMMKTRLVT
jgi:protein SCO1/2